MRKLLAILLLAIFGLPFASALLALTSKSEATLPVCCRHTGKHHCVMSAAKHVTAADISPQFQAPLERCPYGATALPGTTHPSAIAVPAGQVVYAALVIHLCGAVQTESKFRIAHDRSLGKRGPPSTSTL